MARLRLAAMDVILIPGLWLEGQVWSEVARSLSDRGVRVTALTPVGQGDGRLDARLEDQLAAVVEAIDACAEPPLVVGHSAAATLAWLAADARPVARVVMIGGFPANDGKEYAAFFPIVDGVMAFPGWEPFEGADTVDLDEDARARMAAAMHPVPEGVANGIVRYQNPSRYDTPVTLICPEFSPDDVREWMGDLPELAAVKQLALVDIDSGHWPMVTQPEALAELIVNSVREDTA